MTNTTPTERAALILQPDAEYTTMTPDPARMCGNCRWYSELAGTQQCHIVVDGPEPIQRGGFCNRHDLMPDGSAVIAYMENYGVSNPNNSNIPAGIVADALAHSEAAHEVIQQYVEGVQSPADQPALSEDEQDDSVYADEQTRAVPAKYEHISFEPSESMAEEAQRGLDWRSEYGRGGTEVGIARGRDIANRRTLSPETVRRMKAYFDRHEVDKEGEGWSPGEDGYPSNGRIAWALWSGDPGYSWSKQRVESMNAADEKGRGAVDPIPDPILTQETNDDDTEHEFRSARSEMPALAPTQGMVTRRFVDRTVTALDAVQGVIRGSIGIWGNPDRVQFAPGVHVSWGDGEALQYGRVVNAEPDDALKIEVHECVPGRRWIPLGTTVTLPRLSVRATDMHGTWFDYTRPPEMGLDNGMHRRPIMLEHASSAIGAEIAGTITRVWFDQDGIQFDAELNRTLAVFPRIIQKIERGEYKTSSATMEHTAVIRSDGSFEKWILGEHTLTESPSEQRMPSVTLIRSDAQGDAQSRAEGESLSSVEPPVVGEKTMSTTSKTPAQRALSAEQIQQLNDWLTQSGATVADVQAYIASMEQPAPETPAPEMETEMSAARSEFSLESLKAFVAGRMSAPPAPEPRRAHVPQGVNVNVIPDSKTRNLSASDMWFVAKVLGDHKQAMSEDFTRALYAKSADAMKTQAAAGDEFAASFVRKFSRSDEIMATNIAAQGTEWVGVQYATDLWEKIRVSTIYDTFRSLGMMEMSLGQGQDSIYIPTEGADPTWYSAPQANDLSSGRIEVTANPQFVGTGRVLVTPGTLKATVAWSEELDEDSLIPMASWLNTQLQRSAAEVAEYALINGDTATGATTNLNLIDGTPVPGASRPAYLATNGILKLPIITTTSLSFDANNTHTEETYLEVLKKLPNEVNGDVNNVVFLLGVREHFAALNIAAFKTRDVNAQATVENGVLSRVFGRRVLMSGQIGLANSAGKIAGTNPSTTNIYGRIAAAVPRYWAVVNKRDVRFKLSEDPYNDAQLLRVSFRMGVTYRSTTSAAAAAYEVAV